MLISQKNHGPSIFPRIALWHVTFTEYRDIAFVICDTHRVSWYCFCDTCYSQARRFRFCFGGGGKCPPPSNRISGRFFSIEFLSAWKRADHTTPPPPPPPTCSRKFEWYCYFAWIYFDKFSFSTREERNCGGILIFGDIIYGKLNLLCPPQGILGVAKNFLGWHLPLPRHKTTSLFCMLPS